MSVCIATGVFVAVESTPAAASNSQISNVAPPIKSHAAKSKKELETLIATLENTNEDKPLSDTESAGSPLTVLDQFEQLKERFIALRTKEYQKERLTQTETAKVKAGRAALFGGRSVKKAFVTASTSGDIWQVDAHKYQELSGSGDRKHKITALPNGYSMEVSAKEVYRTQHRDHSRITGKLTVTYKRHPLWIRMQCERDWTDLLRIIHS
jgi:hypothetical protein